MFSRHVTLERTDTSPALAPWVEYHWTLRWDLPPDVAFTSAIVPHPSSTVSVEHGTARRPETAGEAVVVTGVVTHRFDVEVHGRGWVHGVKLRPGAVTALTGHDAKALVDRTVPVREVLPPAVGAGLRELAPDTPSAVATATACAALESLLPAEPDPSYDALLRVIADMLADRSLLRVAEVAERHGIGRRSLERLFARYVGVGPKWVLARYRMHDVVTALDEGYAGPLADLAATFGWFDQAHFGRDFAALVGCPPSAYRRRSQE
ncbi:hypothetical protein HIDPHFAB_00979 [Nocardioides sp. T2.26MG-1]|nr:hypothetical protein HIDPHFAB_00979 [Nocardioides sp. T2.26MG-1]